MCYINKFERFELNIDRLVVNHMLDFRAMPLLDCHLQRHVESAFVKIMGLS